MWLKIFECVWNAIGMSTIGAAVGFAINGQWAESLVFLMLSVIALICYLLIRMLEPY